MQTRVVNNIPEWRYQEAVIKRLRDLEDAGLPIACAGDMAAGKRTPRAIAEAQATGLTPGEPDVRVYLPGARICHIELKTPRGRVSEEQKKRHARLRALGHVVTVIARETPDLAADAAERFVRLTLLEFGGNDSPLFGDVS